MSTEERSEHEIERSAGPARSGRRKWKRIRANPRVLLIAVCVGLLLAGVTIGYLVGSGRTGPSSETASSEEAATLWTCSMDPQVKLPEPGLCPICNMPLIPLDDEPAGPRELKMSKAAMALAGIQTTPVKRQYVTKLVRMVGKVEHDETRMIDIAARVPGRLDRLFVNYTGITVRKGHHLVWMYSPDLVVAQRELLQTWQAYQRLSAERDKRLVEANLRSAEDKLRLLGLLPEQIEQIKRDGKPSDHLTIYAPVSGIVIGKHANEGAYVKEGQKIYSIVDLSRVWVYLDAYESDLPWLRYGQKVEFETESHPGEVFEGTVVFIDPVLDEKKRTAGVRVHVERKNDDLRLKPGMFVRAKVHSRLAKGDRVLPPSLKGKWISPMHPEIIKDEPGTCDICGMPLVRAKELAKELGFVSNGKPAQAPLVIPATAPLITGKRAVVYVRVPTSEDLFKQITAIWKAVEYPPEGRQPTLDGLMEVIEAAWEKAKRFKKWRDAVEMPPLPDNKVSNFDHLFAVIEKAWKEADQPPDGKRLNFDELVGVIQTAWQEAGKLSDWERPSFAGREIVLGERADDYYIVRHGLEEDQEVVTAGNFKIDSALQIQAKDSMMSFAGLEVPDEFRRQLAAVYAPYFKLHQALGNDQGGNRLQDALRAFSAMRKAAGAVHSEMLDERSGRQWQEIRKRLEKSLATELRGAEIEEVRQAFEPVAAEMLKLVDKFGHTEQVTLYKVYCPMAFENKGASWLQSGRKIANPYFGYKMMVGCSRIKRIFGPAVADPDQRDSGKEDPR